MVCDDVLWKILSKMCSYFFQPKYTVKYLYDLKFKNMHRVILIMALLFTSGTFNKNYVL
jgi:hypothetical protein